MSKFEIYKGNGTGDEVYRWRLKDNNHQIIAISEEGFLQSSIASAVKRLQENVGSETPIYEEDESRQNTSNYRFEWWQSPKDNQWYWRFFRCFLALPLCSYVIAFYSHR